MTVDFSLWLTFAVQVRDINFCSTCGYSAWPSPTLMGWVLLGPIRNRVEYGFFFFFKIRSESGFYQKNPKPDLDITWLLLNYKKPLYIYCYN